MKPINSHAYAGGRPSQPPVGLSRITFRFLLPLDRQFVAHDLNARSQADDVFGQVQLVCVGDDELIRAGEIKIGEFLGAMEKEGTHLKSRGRLAKAIQMILIGGSISAITDGDFVLARKLTEESIDAAIRAQKG